MKLAVLSVRSPSYVNGMERIDIASPNAPAETLLRAVKVLHEGGIQRIQIFPYMNSSGSAWRCCLQIDGQSAELADSNSALLWSSAAGWELPGCRGGSPVSPEELADNIWTVLTDDEKRRAQQPDPAYAFWYSALLDYRKYEELPSLFRDYGSYYSEGYMGFENSPHQSKFSPPRRFPLPPGNSLTWFIDKYKN